MTVKVTFEEIIDKGHWLDFYEEKGYNEWMLNEGIADRTDQVELTIEEAKKYGLLKEGEENEI